MPQVHQYQNVWQCMDLGTCLALLQPHQYQRFFCSLFRALPVWTLFLPVCHVRGKLSSGFLWNSLRTSRTHFSNDCKFYHRSCGHAFTNTKYRYKYRDYRSNIRDRHVAEVYIRFYLILPGAIKVVPFLC